MGAPDGMGQQQWLEVSFLSFFYLDETEISTFLLLWPFVSGGDCWHWGEGALTPVALGVKQPPCRWWSLARTCLLSDTINPYTRLEIMGKRSLVSYSECGHLEGFACLAGVLCGRYSKLPAEGSHTPYPGQPFAL